MWIMVWRYFTGILIDIFLPLFDQSQRPKRTLVLMSPGRRRGSRRPATSRWWWSWSWRWRRTGRSGTCSPGSGTWSSGAPPGQGRCQHKSTESLYTKPWVRSGKEWRGGWRPGTGCPLYTGRTAAGWTDCSWTWIKQGWMSIIESLNGKIRGQWPLFPAPDIGNSHAIYLYNSNFPIAQWNHREYVCSVR